MVVERRGRLEDDIASGGQPSGGGRAAIHSQPSAAAYHVPSFSQPQAASRSNIGPAQKASRPITNQAAVASNRPIGGINNGNQAGHICRQQ